MNKFILTILTILITIFSYGQFCNTSSLQNGGLLTVTNTPQITTSTGNGNRLYYTFFAEPGCVYTFETCGLATNDTYIRIYNGINPSSALTVLQYQNDDGCGTQSTINFPVVGNGEMWSILITNYTCATLSQNIRVRYVKDCTHTNQECFGATQICNDISFSGNSGGLGQWSELNSSNDGCLSGEHQSSWYYFIPTVNGTISMTIQTTVDYDFAIWRNSNCANLGSPIRCSFASSNGNTGLGNGATDNSEGIFGNRWVAPLNVTAGVFYIMVIDNFTADNSSFTIDFTFSVPDLLNCTPTPLPINLLSFTGENIDDENIINWVTASEINNDEFRIEHSSDTQNWKTIGYIDGNNAPSMYEFKDADYRNIVNYYRLIQIDFDGTEHYQGTIAIDNTIKGKEIIGIYNILGQEVDENYKGIILIKYSNNTIIKSYR
jgi:hypothetical protein